MAIKKRYKFTLISLFVLLFAYLLVGYVLAPKIIAELLTSQISKHLAMQAEFSKVTFNPFTFSANFKDLKLTDSNQKSWYESQSTGINLDLVNFIWGEINLSTLSFNQARILINISQDGTIKTPALPVFEPSNDSEESLNFSIDNIQLKQVSMSLQLGAIQEDFSLNIKNIALDHDAFSLDDQDNHFEIKIITEKDESIALNGHYNHLQKIFKSDLNIVNWQANILNQVLPNDLAITTESGLIQAEGQLNWNLSQKPQLYFSAIKVSGFQSRWHNDVLVTDLQADIKQVSVDIETQTVDIQHIDSDQGEWQINWPLSVLNTNNQQTDAQTFNKVEKIEPLIISPTDSVTWKITNKQLNINNWPIKFVDTNLNESLEFNLSTLGLLKANNLNQPFTLNSQFKLSEDSLLQLNSEQTVSPLSIAADIKLEQLSLQYIEPWLNDLAGLTSLQGSLNTTQRFVLTGDEFTVLGQLSVAGGQIKDRTGQINANWDEIQIGANSVSSNDKTIVLDQITLNQASGTISTESNQQVNIETKQSDVKSTTSKNKSTNNDWVIKIGSIKSK